MSNKTFRVKLWQEQILLRIGKYSFESLAINIQYLTYKMFSEALLPNDEAIYVLTMVSWVVEFLICASQISDINA